MKKVFVAFVPAAVLLLASFGSGVTPRVSAEGPSFDKLFELVKNHPDVIKSEFYKPFEGGCIFRFWIRRGGVSLEGLTGWTGPQLWALGWGATLGEPVLNATAYWFKIPPAYCNSPPSGTSPATNPVPVSTPQPSDSTNLMNLVIAGLVALGVGFLFFPQLARARI